MQVHINFWREECRVYMQIIEQEELAVCHDEGYVARFSDILVCSYSSPELGSDSVFYLRGYSKEEHERIVNVVCSTESQAQRLLCLLEKTYRKLWCVKEFGDAMIEENQ